MEPFLTTFMSVLAVELTDKTRLIALLLCSRYRAPVQLFFGMTLGYVIPIALAVWAAECLSGLFPPSVWRWAVGSSFLGLGVYMLFARGGGGEETEEKWLAKLSRLAPFWLGFLLVMLTEFADKSQIVTAGIMLKYEKGWPVFSGSLIAQAVLNFAYVAFGHVLGKRLPVKFIRWASAILFLLFGIAALLG